VSELTSTVVFADLVTPAETLGSRGLDEPAAGRTSQLAQLRALVTEHGGETVSTLGDGLTATFPVPSGAIRFAVAAQQQVSSSSATRRASPGLKLGISIGELLRAGESCQGRAVTEAARLCQLAGPGHILSSRAVRLVAGPVRGVDIQERGSQHLEGLPEPVDMDEIIWPPASERPLRVLLADDAVLIRQGVARLLEDEGIAVIGQTGEAARIAELADKLAPDVLITDVRMPPTFTLEGLRVALELRVRNPQIAVLVLSQHLETRYAVELLGEGASGVGYLLKERVTAVDEFIAAVRRVASGGTAIDPEMVSLLISRSQRNRGLSGLSPREEEILSLMAQGLSNSGIARRLTLSIRTVESHVSSIFTKLGLFPQADDERRVLAVIQNLRG
jgi:DNA-binding NarL/FixJ family response regulator/class 3 adenylate cyclase